MLDKLFYKEWLNVQTLLDTESKVKFTMNCTPDFFYSLKFNSDSLREYACEAALECSKILGNNIALCLSGGLDSQFMIMCFLAAGVKFKVYTLEFHDSLNDYDCLHAKKFCDEKKIEYNGIPFDVVHFLNFKNETVGEKYKSASPHFNVHYELFNMLKDNGHTGVAAGGVYPYYENLWGENLTINNLNFVNYCHKENYIGQGSFLSFYPKLAWALGLLHKPIFVDYNKRSLTEIEKIQAEGYKRKIAVFDQFKFDLIPQQKKYTGFEKTKLHYQNKTGDGWFFEKAFRQPLVKKFVRYYENKIVLQLTKEQEQALTNINNKHMVSC